MLPQLAAAAAARSVLAPSVVSLLAAQVLQGMQLPLHQQLLQPDHLQHYHPLGCCCSCCRSLAPDPAVPQHALAAAAAPHLAAAKASMLSYPNAAAAAAADDAP
jgi:hypothetical protein